MNEYYKERATALANRSIKSSSRFSFLFLTTTKKWKLTLIFPVYYTLTHTHTHTHKNNNNKYEKVFNPEPATVFFILCGGFLARIRRCCRIYFRHYTRQNDRTDRQTEQEMLFVWGWYMRNACKRVQLVLCCCHILIDISIVVCMYKYAT